jgi:hypothetical protein
LLFDSLDESRLRIASVAQEVTVQWVLVQSVAFLDGSYYIL